MSNPVIKAVIRTKFLMNSRDKASAIIRSYANAYMKLSDRFGVVSGMEKVAIPHMIGVDPEMQGWSFFQILEHSAIVNRSIAATVEALALGKEPTGAALINPRIDVLPQGVSGSDQIGFFRQSVDDYLELLSALPELRGTKLKNHPLFGPFDAHKWHCMFGFHLGLHLKQAEKVLSLLGK